ncbi:MAG: response regulator transcription factor [Puniceicoccales bacterium]|jgi:DNA-binding response OmpR family regulator|nr:response regulator transcription factor [Puniceicoccales bacterium]
MRILVVEDSPRLQRSISLALRKTGYSVDVASDGDEGLWQAESNEYDVIILDWMLPKRDGLELMKSLRAKGNKTHILMLTAKDAVEDRVAGLDNGADDYLVKPFAMPELLARVQSLCRRLYGVKNSCASIGGLEIDFASRSVRRRGVPVDLAAREYQLLEYLARRQGQVVSRADIEAHIYDNMVDPMSNVVDSAICILRKKIATGEDSEPLIHTRRGMGYILESKPKSSC